MKPSDRLRVSQLFHATLTHGGDDRAAFLTAACARDDTLRRDVESLLANSGGMDAMLVSLAGAAVEHFGILAPLVDAPRLSAVFTGTSRFELRRCLGRGGFGTVYEALDRNRGVRVALKVLHAVDPSAVYRFKREFRTLADMTHPNLVRLDELFNEGGHWFFTMELVDGQPIIDFVRSGTEPAADADRGIDPPPDAIDEERLKHVFGQLVDGLEALHRHGIVHRDIKPANVLVTFDGRVVVLDFGLATELTGDETLVTVMAGTPAYMAPEQAREHPVLPASDWYSVGVILYEALSGRLPYSGTSIDVLVAKQSAPPSPDGASAGSGLMALSIALLHPDQSQRPTASDVRRRLDVERVAAVDEAKSAVVRPPDLIGRGPHRRALEAALDAASAGQSVVVFMPGPSGAGKTALLNRFLSDLRRRHRAVVVAGRCHEREALPYKAVDGLVDGLAQYLQRLPPIEVARRLPREAALIAQLFPVLLRVAEIESARTRLTPSLDAVELRRRAATALRELLARISDRSPLVLAIDDLQWGDSDSGSLLQEILRLPDPPPVLCLLAYRSEDADAPLVEMLRETMRRDAGRREVRTVVVDELTADEAYELACRELAARPDVARELGAQIARESRGNSFFVHELVRHALTVGGPVRLETVIRDRVAALPRSARQLLTAAAVSAQPIVLPVAAAAARFDGDPHETLRLLRAGRLLRSHEAGTGQELELYHDRIREAIADDLDAAAHRVWHARLASAWEASGLARPETLVTHFHGAGDLAQTARHAARAAATAEEALAFQRAASYYRLLLEVDEPSQRSRWQVCLGDALALAGRGREAATAYLEAMPGGSPDMAIELERRAAEQLIRAGHLDHAARVLDSLLPRIGIRPGRSEAGAFAGLIARRLALAARGSAFRERSEREIPPEELRRIDVMWSIGAPLSLVELARGNNLHLRGAHHALRAGEPKRVVRALAALACASAIGGAHRDRHTIGALNRAKALATRIGDPTAIARTVLAEAMCHKVVGRWSLARQCLERAIKQLALCPGTRWEIETARTMLHDTLFWMGEWKLLFNEIPARRQEADDHGDLYSATHVAVRLAPLRSLAADEPERARSEAIAGMIRWPSGQFDLQRRWELCSLTEADLYDGRPAEAWDRLRSAWPRLRWTLRAFQNARIEMRFLRARTALARAADQPEYLNEAAGDAGRLERENAPWASALATLVRGSVSVMSGQRQVALLHLDAAEAALREAGMAHYAAASVYRRGQLLGGDEGRSRVAPAVTFFESQGIVNIDRIANLLAPGRW